MQQVTQPLQVIASFPRVSFGIRLWHTIVIAFGIAIASWIVVTTFFEPQLAALLSFTSWLGGFL